MSRFDDPPPLTRCDISQFDNSTTYIISGTANFSLLLPCFSQIPNLSSKAFALFFPDVLLALHSSYQIRRIHYL